MWDSLHLSKEGLGRACWWVSHSGRGVKPESSRQVLGCASHRAWREEHSLPGSWPQPVMKPQEQQHNHSSEAKKIVLVCVCVRNHFSCVRLCDPMDWGPPGSSVHGTLQARILEWLAISSSRGYSRPRDQTRISYVSCTGRQVLYHECHLGSPFVYRKKQVSASNTFKKNLSLALHCRPSPSLH